MNPNTLLAEVQKPAYVGLNALEKAIFLNNKTIAVPGNSIYVSREQIRSAFDSAEFLALIMQRQNVVLAVLTSDTVAVEGTDADLIQAAFNGATNTLSALLALRVSAKEAAKTSIADSIGWGGLSDALLADWITQVES